jgi:N-methylhydantoinase B/oxoprolinase/acetone carboxylase alpha subunit
VGVREAVWLEVEAFEFTEVKSSRWVEVIRAAIRRLAISVEIKEVLEFSSIMATN